jgi:hypothetical protein
MQNKKSLIVIVIVTSIIFLFIGYKIGANSEVKLFNEKTVDELLQQVKTKEFQKIDSLISENLIIVTEDSDSYFDSENIDICRGYIKNNAKVTIAKDIIIQLSYFTKTKSLISSDTLKIFEYIQPNDSLLINERINKPKLTNLVEISILSVKVE